MGARDNLRAQDRTAIGAHHLDDIFTSDFEARIHLAFHFGDVFAGGPHAGMRFVYGTIYRVAIDRHCTDEHIAHHAVAQHLGARPNLARGIPAYVHTHIPGPTGQALEAVNALVAVTAKPLDLGRKFIGRLAAIENAHCVPAGQQRLNDVPAHELGPAEDQGLHVRNSEGCRIEAEVVFERGEMNQVAVELKGGDPSG
jgi:hypothetical protein